METTLLNLDLIFGKTPAGEDAVLQRTRIVQRNTRMVLILVDGNATVAELCEKTGNPQLTQQALIDLENDGFIVRRTERESDAMMRSARARRNKQAERPPAPPEADAPAMSQPSAITLSLATAGKDSRPPFAAPDATQEARALDHSTPAPVTAILGPESGTVFISKDQATASLPSVDRSAEEQRGPSIVGRLRQMAATSAAESSGAAPIQRAGPRAGITWPLAAALCVLLLCLLLVLAAVFFPYSLVVPELEAALAQRSGHPARIGGARATLLPSPALVLMNVRIGDESNNLRVGELRVQPDIWSLFSAPMVVRTLELGNTELSPAAIDVLARSLQTAASGAPRTAVRHIGIVRSQAAFAGFSTGEMGGEVRLSADGMLQAVSLRSTDRTFLLEAQRSAGGNLAIRAEGLNWHPSPQSPYAFASLAASGELRGDALAVDAFEVRVFDGLAKGSALVRAGTRTTLTGEIRFERINLKRFAEALAVEQRMQGSVDGRLVFSASGDGVADLFSAIEGDGTFTASRGSLGGIDLPEAVRRSPAIPSTLGGETRFDRLSGAVHLHRGSYRFSRLLLSAGLMEASGQVEIGRGAQLRGTVNVQMRGRVDHSARTVSLSGTLATPQLRTP